MAELLPIVEAHFNSHWHGRLVHDGLDQAKYSRGTMYIVSLSEQNKDALKIDDVFALYLIDLAESLP